MTWVVVHTARAPVCGASATLRSDSRYAPGRVRGARPPLTKYSTCFRSFILVLFIGVLRNDLRLCAMKPSFTKLTPTDFSDSETEECGGGEYNFLSPLPGTH